MLYRSPSQLRNTGGVWLSCDAMDTVSKNNKTAAVKLCLAEVHMLRDALSEVETVSWLSLSLSLSLCYGNLYKPLYCCYATAEIKQWYE